MEKSDTGVSFGPPENKLGIKGSPTRTVILENVAASRMIGEPGTGFRTALATLDHTRITIAAQAIGIAQGALDYAVGYVKQRSQFGQAIAEFQGVQFMLADMAMKLEAARQLTYHAAALSEQAMAGKQVSGLTFASSAAKCFASDTAMARSTKAPIRSSASSWPASFSPVSGYRSTAGFRARDGKSVGQDDERLHLRSCLHWRLSAVKRQPAEVALAILESA